MNSIQGTTREVIATYDMVSDLNQINQELNNVDDIENSFSIISKKNLFDCGNIEPSFPRVEKNEVQNVSGNQVEKNSEEKSPEAKKLTGILKISGQQTNLKKNLRWADKHALDLKSINYVETEYPTPNKRRLIKNNSKPTMDFWEDNEIDFQFPNIKLAIISGNKIDTSTNVNNESAKKSNVPPPVGLVPFVMGT